MNDWIEQFKQQRESNYRDELERERILQRRLERLQLKLLEFIQDTQTRLAEGVKDLRAGFPNDGRYHLRYKSNGDGFSLGGTLPQTPRLTLALDATKTELRTTASKGRSPNTDAYIGTGLDDTYNLFVELEEKRYYTPEEFAKALMSYVMDAGNAKP